MQLALDQGQVTAALAQIHATPSSRGDRLEPAAALARLQQSSARRTGSLTFGSTRRGVLRLMKDFMTLLRGAEVGVMSIWFLCTVCRKVRRGRTTCG